MNSNMLVRLAGLIGGGLVGWSIAAYLRRVASGLDTTLQLAVALAVALVGLVVAPYITTAPLRWVPQAQGAGGARYSGGDHRADPRPRGRRPAGDPAQPVAGQPGAALALGSGRHLRPISASTSW